LLSFLISFFVLFPSSKQFVLTAFLCLLSVL
jgi:hypothetical protein